MKISLSSYNGYFLTSAEVSGTIRSNLDPFNQHDDATLWDALKRAHLVDSTAGTSTPPTAGPESNTVSRLDLDTVIEDEGNNLSVGQVSPVCLHHPF